MNDRYRCNKDELKNQEHKLNQKNSAINEGVRLEKYCPFEEIPFEGKAEPNSLERNFNAGKPKKT